MVGNEFGDTGREQVIWVLIAMRIACVVCFKQESDSDSHFLKSLGCYVGKGLGYRKVGTRMFGVSS